MIKHEITADWKGGMSFENTIDGFTNIVDAATEFGGNNLGPSPKKLILAGLAGCTGMDIVSLLTKMREPLSSLSLKIEADMTEDHPKVYSDIIIYYRFKASDNLDKAKVEKAVKMSQDTYCGVAAMLRKGSNVLFEIVYE
jgi:putative redox protein